MTSFKPVKTSLLPVFFAKAIILFKFPTGFPGLCSGVPIAFAITKPGLVSFGRKSANVKILYIFFFSYKRPFPNTPPY